MEDIFRSHLCDPIASSSSCPSKLPMHRDSHVISKLLKPKVRIIHVFAPEIIKTDVANFRELVQRLTGKPGGGEISEGMMMIKRKARTTPSRKKKAMQLAVKGLSAGNLMKEESHEMAEITNEIWGGGEINYSTAGNFLDGFADLNGFMHDLTSTDNFPLTSSSSQSSHMMVAYDQDINPPLLTN